VPCDSGTLCHEGDPLFFLVFFGFFFWLYIIGIEKNASSPNESNLIDCMRTHSSNNCYIVCIYISDVQLKLNMGKVYTP